MADGFYDHFKEQVLSGNIDFTTDDIRVIGVDSGYTPDLTADQNLSDILAGLRSSTAVQITTPTVTDGVFDGDDITLQGSGADPTAALVIYKHTGVESTSTLIAFLDTVLGLPTGLGFGSTLSFNASGILKPFG